MNQSELEKKQKSADKSKEKSKDKSKDKDKDKDYLKKVKDRQKLRQRHQNKQKTSKDIRKIGDYQVDFENSIGFGTFGTVHKAIKTGNQEIKFACKFIQQKKIANMELYEDGLGKSTKQRLSEQITTHKQLTTSEHIVKLYDAMQQKDGFYMFMQMCDSDLGKLLKDKGPLSQEEALGFFKQLVEGYQFLYQRKISHRDLKPENLLLNGKILKISDFGFVKNYQNLEAYSKLQTKSKFLTQSLVGSINYMAPEIIKSEAENSKYNPFQSDVWSMGVILYKMLYNKEPYPATNTKQLLQKIEEKELDIPTLPKVSTKTINLIKQMIEKDCSLRISFKNLSIIILDRQLHDKEKELMFYNELMIKISYDSSNHATIRQIGIEEYQKFSARLMSLIHQKRVNLLQTTSNLDVTQQIKNQISLYANTFHEAIKYVAQLEKFEGGLLSLLTIYRQKLASYPQFSLLHKQVQYFLLLLLIMYNFEKKNVSIDYIYTVLENQKNKKMTLNLLQSIKNKNLGK